MKSEKRTIKISKADKLAFDINSMSETKEYQEKTKAKDFYDLEGKGYMNEKYFQAEDFKIHRFTPKASKRLFEIHFSYIVINSKGFYLRNSIPKKGFFAIYSIQWIESDTVALNWTDVLLSSMKELKKVNYNKKDIRTGKFIRIESFQSVIDNLKVLSIEGKKSDIEQLIINRLIELQSVYFNWKEYNKNKEHTRFTKVKAGKVMKAKKGIVSNNYEFSQLPETLMRKKYHVKQYRFK